MIRIFPALILLAGAVASVAAPLPAQEPRLEGRLVDAETGDAVVFALVHSGESSVAPDRGGGFALCGLSADSVPLRIVANGYAPLDTVVRAAADIRIPLRRLAAGEPGRIVIGERGLSLRHPLLLVDGVRFAPPPRCSPFQALQSMTGLRPEDIDTIEVLRGPAAVQRYGPDAADGVIVVTTRCRPG